MNSKERVLAALNHQTTDRTPCNYLGTPEADRILLSHFKTDKLDIVLQRLGVDLRVIDAPYIGPELRQWPDGRFENYWGHIRKPVKNQAGTYNESVEFPYADFKTVDDVKQFHWPQAQWFDYSHIEEDGDRYKDYAVVFGSSGNFDLLNGTSFGRGVEQLMFDIALEDPIALECMEQRFQACYARSEKALQAAKGKIDILWLGDDLGTQNGLVVSPQTLQKLIFPKLKQMCDLAHAYGAKTMFHSCGSTRKIWNDLIDAGVDIYDTIQPEAAEMNPADLKKDFGDRICFHGAISTQKTLPFSTPEGVAEEVRERIATVGQNGGYIVAPSHNIQPDTPLDNILAMYETIRNV